MNERGRSSTPRREERNLWKQGNATVTKTPLNDVRVTEFSNFSFPLPPRDIVSEKQLQEHD